MNKELVWKSSERKSCLENKYKNMLCLKCLISICFFFFFFNCYLADPRPTLSHSQGDSLTNTMLITAF